VCCSCQAVQPRCPPASKHVDCQPCQTGGCRCMRCNQPCVPVPTHQQPVGVVLSGPAGQAGRCPLPAAALGASALCLLWRCMFVACLLGRLPMTCLVQRQVIVGRVLGAMLLQSSVAAHMAQGSQHLPAAAPLRLCRAPLGGQAACVPCVQGMYGAGVCEGAVHALTGCLQRGDAPAVGCDPAAVKRGWGALRRACGVGLVGTTPCGPATPAAALHGHSECLGGESCTPACLLLEASVHVEGLYSASAVCPWCMPRHWLHTLEGGEQRPTLKGRRMSATPSTARGCHHVCGVYECCRACRYVGLWVLMLFRMRPVRCVCCGPGSRGRAHDPSECLVLPTHTTMTAATNPPNTTLVTSAPLRRVPWCSTNGCACCTALVFGNSTCVGSA
jgi:hypothetical protein